MLIICEGIDRVGKTTVANYFESLGYEVVHMSAPAKHHTKDSFFQEMIDLVSSASVKDIFLDRSYYGELIWSQIYDRKPLLTEEDMEALREIEDVCGVRHVLMVDNNVEAHWKRCVDNKEPLTRQQFVKARALYSDMAHKYRFELITLPQFIKQYPDVQSIIDKQKSIEFNENSHINASENKIQLSEVDVVSKINHNKTPEQSKLEVANAVNDILSKRILKSKSAVYDNIENEIRGFLNTKLGKLLGENSNQLELSPEEVKFYKTMYARAQLKQ